MANKILILANSSSGLYDFRNELMAQILKHHSLTVSVPTGDKVENIFSLGCEVITTPIDRRGINPVKDLKLLRQYKKMLKSEKPDLVITYTIKPNIYGSLACKRRKIPYAVNITGLGTAFQGQGILRKLVTFLYKTALKKANVVFFENSGNRQVFLDEKIVPAEKACLLSGAGVNLERYAPAPYPADGKIHFLFVGRVMKEKGIGELFEAMEWLTAQGENCCLDVLGNYEEDYAETIQRCEAQGWLYYHGYQADVRPFIEKAHCFVLPSYHEGMANTNLECAAMARPVITSDIPGCREAVTPASGLLCKPQDANSLFSAMEAFLRLPHSQKAAMGIAGRAHMEAVFDKKKVVQSTLDALNL